MKKLLSLQLIFLLTATLLIGCGKTSDDESKTDSASTPSTETTVSTENIAAEDENNTEAFTSTDPISITALKGPTAMGMVKLMTDTESASAPDYTFNIAASVDEVTPAVVQGSTDIAAVPANLASVLYNKTNGDMQVLAINTLGVLYIVENGDSIHSVTDLKGKTIYASGKGATPEYALNYILSSNGINPQTDVTIEWKSEHTECLAALTSTENGIALLPQPFVTVAQSKVPNLKVALDLTEEWNKLNSDSALLTGVIIAKKSFVESHTDAVNEFLAQYKASVSYVNENVDDAAALVGKYGIVEEAVAKNAIPACNITYIDGNDMKQKLSGYLNTLFEQNPAAVGGTLPADDFYYQP